MCVMHGVGWVVLFASALVGCGDGTILVNGTVTDTSGIPVEGASVYLGDRVFWEELDAYLENGGELPGALWDTGPDGWYRAGRTVAGSGRHDFWLVVKTDGYADHAQRVWNGDGLPDPDARTIDVVLEPAAAQ